MRFPIPQLSSLLRRSPSDSRDTPAATLPPLVGSGTGDLEVTHLGRYVFVITLVASCAMLSAWSRIDLVETSAALGSASARLESAQAEHARLTLERAALTDPTHLAAAADALGLEQTVPVVTVAVDGAPQ
jgi:hypothetical protein